MAVVYLIGACLTAIAIALLFSRRYPGSRRRLWVGIVIGLAAMPFWPVTLWIAVALWQTGFGRSRISPPTVSRLPKKVVVPASVVGSLVTLVAIGSTADPAPASTPPAIPVSTSTSSPTPTLSAVPSTTATTATASPTPSPTTAPVATTTPTPRPAPQPAPKPQPRPQPQPEPRPEPQRRPQPEPEPESDDDGGGGSVGTVNPGSFCDPGGSIGVTSKGTPMVCRPGSDGRLRWGRAG